MAEVSAPLEEAISKRVFFLHLLEDLVHSKDRWEVRIGESLHPVEVLKMEDRVGLRVTSLRLTEEITCVPVLLRNGTEVWWHPEFTFPALVQEFVWWFSLQPLTV